MRIGEFILMSATKLDEYIKERISGIEDFRDGETVEELLELYNFTSHYSDNYYKKRKIIKKREAEAQGLGSIGITLSLDLMFYDINKNKVGTLWRYGNGTARFDCDKFKNSYPEFMNILDILNYYRDHLYEAL